MSNQYHSERFIKTITRNRKGRRFGKQIREKYERAIATASSEGENLLNPEFLKAVLYIKISKQDIIGRTKHAEKIKKNFFKSIK